MSYSIYLEMLRQVANSVVQPDHLNIVLAFVGYLQ